MKRHDRRAITVIGVGGSGRAVVNEMIRRGNLRERFPEELATFCAITHELDGDCAEARETVREAVANTRLVLVVTGLDGVSGATLASVIGEMARETDALVIGLAVLPLCFEGSWRNKLALEGLRALREAVDTLVIAPGNMAGAQGKSFDECFRAACDLCAEVGVAFHEDLLSRNRIAFDLADYKEIFRNGRLAVAGTGRGNGPQGARQAAEEAFGGHIAAGLPPEGVVSAFLYVRMSPEASIEQLAELVEAVREKLHADAPLYLSVTHLESGEEEELNALLVAVGEVSIRLLRRAPYGTQNNRRGKTMSLNYFNIMSGADKEMMHSAMLKFLLGYDDFFRKELFPECPAPIVATGGEGAGNPRIRLEAPYPERKRIDVEAHSADGKYVLLIENKFKAFPAEEQLQTYDALYKLEEKEKESRTRGKTRVSYLVCFNRECVTFNRQGGRIPTAQNTSWHIRTYEEIRNSVAAYLKNRGEALSPEVRYFLEHYVAYLDDYYAAYQAVSGNYSLAFAAEDIPDDMPLPAGLPAKLRDTRFWKRLILSAVGNAFAQQCHANGLEGFEPKFNDGNTPEPFLDIIAINDPNWRNTRSPRLYVQLQGRELKLFACELDSLKKSGVAGTAFLNHCLAVQGNIARKPGKQCAPNKSSAMLRHIGGKSASFKIYAEELVLDVPVAEIVNQLKDFVLRMDAALKKTGPFSPVSA